MVDRELETADGDCFLCDICSNTFTKAWGLKKIHLGLKMKSQFKCNVCDDISSTQRELRKHCAATKHQILREFLCATCTNSYFNQRELDIHVVHLNLTNPPCKICGKLFGRKSSVRAHLATVQIWGELVIIWRNSYQIKYYLRIQCFKQETLILNNCWWGSAWSHQWMVCGNRLEIAGKFLQMRWSWVTQTTHAEPRIPHYWQNQTKPNQTKPNQNWQNLTKPNQTHPTLTKPNETKLPGNSSKWERWPTQTGHASPITGKTKTTLTQSLLRLQWNQNSSKLSWHPRIVFLHLRFLRILSLADQ